DNTVSTYSINAGTGALTPGAGSPFAAGTLPGSIAFLPNGAYAYVANLTSNNVSAYSINAGTGALTGLANSPFAAGTTPRSIAIANISADLAVTMSAPASVVAGNNVSYTITVTNNGPSDAQTVSWTDTLPANTSFVSLNQGSGPAFTCATGSTMTCNSA